MLAGKVFPFSIVIFGHMFLSLLLILAAFIALYLRPAAGLKRFDTIAGYSLRLAGNVVFLLVYTYYYGWGDLTADPAAFMEESQMLTDVFFQSPKAYFAFLFGYENQEMVHHYLAHTFHWDAGDLTLINDSTNVIRVNSLLNFVTGGNVILNSSFLSFFSLMGFKDLYLSLRNRVQIGDRTLWYALVLFPSTLFWTSGMLKEPFMMMGFCYLLSALFGSHSTSGKTWRYILAIVLLMGFKPYVLACLVPLLLIKWLFKPERHSGLTSWLYLVFPVVLFTVTLLIPATGERITSYLTRKQYDFINVGRGGLHAYADTCFFYFRPSQYEFLDIRKNGEIYLLKPIHAKRLETGKASPFHDVALQPNKKPWFRYYMAEGSKSYVSIPQLKNQRLRLITTAPHALMNGAFRPFFGDSGGWLKYPAIIETLLLFGFLAYVVIKGDLRRRENTGMILFLLAFSIILLLLIGWITPVLGAIVRYRIPAYFSLFIIALLLIRKRKYS